MQFCRLPLDGAVASGQSPLLTKLVIGIQRNLGLLATTQPSLLSTQTQLWVNRCAQNAKLLNIRGSPLANNTRYRREIATQNIFFKPFYKCDHAQESPSRPPNPQHLPCLLGFLFLFFLSQRLSCTPGWFWTPWSSCLNVPRPGITGMHHHIWRFFLAGSKSRTLCVLGKHYTVWAPFCPSAASIIWFRERADVVMAIPSSFPWAGAHVQG